MVKQDLKSNMMEADCSCHLIGGLEAVGGRTPCSQDAMVRIMSAISKKWNCASKLCAVKTKMFQ